MTNYAIELLKKEELKILDAMDLLNATTEESDTTVAKNNLKAYLTNIKSSINTLESNRGLVISAADGEIHLNSKGIKIKSNENINMDKYKWDATVNKASEIIDQKWNELKGHLGETTKGTLREWKSLPSNTDSVEHALSILKEINKGGGTFTRLKLLKNDSVTVVEDFSYFCNSNYMSHGLLDAIQNKRTLTSMQKKELETFIIEVVIEI